MGHPVAAGFAEVAIDSVLTILIFGRCLARGLKEDATNQGHGPWQLRPVGAFDENGSKTAGLKACPERSRMGHILIRTLLGARETQGLSTPHNDPLCGSLCSGRDDRVGEI